MSSISDSDSITDSDKSVNLVDLFEIKEINKVKMSSPKLTYDTGIKTIPIYGGEEKELMSFLKTCEYVLNNIVETFEPLVLEGILAKLTGRASQVTRFKNIDNYEKLKEVLVENFGVQQTVGQLQLELAACMQLANEGIKVYYEKVEALCFQLIEALLLENTRKAEEAVINKMIKRQALTVFVAGLREPYTLSCVGEIPE
ncbi:Retrotransposon gag domain [Cinara cedri]|uniref:Retrotransposon gag domain n=1 Tax=Cinara cedri TaxID=506608 RepID=A0A5E4N0M7_9HEMI|nr:Retrotransposon gag domain [Cinara cedri]